MKKSLSILFLIVTLAVIAYFETDDIEFERQTTIPIGVDRTVPVNGQSEEMETSLNPVLEYHLESTDLDDGYIVETYREYEVYKDKKGNVIEAIPTANYEYLRYKK